MRARVGRISFSIFAAGLVAVSFQHCGGVKSSFVDESSEDLATLDDSLSAPAQLSASAVSAERIDLTWTDFNSGESGFLIERSSSFSGPFASGQGEFYPVTSVGANTTSFSDTGLLGDTTYAYRVRAKSPRGVSPPSSSTTARTSPTPTSPPSPPAGLTASAPAPTIINLAWSDNSNNEAYFKVERSDNGGTSFTQIASVVANNTGFRDINLNPGSSYVYRVRASNSKGDSGFSANATVTMPAAGNTATFQWIFTNLLEPNCVSCHGGNLNAAGISYANFNATRATVAAGNSGGSRLYTAISGGRMPPGGGITALQLNALRAWIDAGAANN